jgi:hypothetical protein
MRREERKRKEQEILHDLIVKGGLKGEILEIWQRETRRKKSAFYDRLAELSEEDKIRYESLTDRRMIDSEKLNEMIIYIEDMNGCYEAILLRRPEIASRLTKKELCKWWCEEYEATPFAFEWYWKALRPEIKDLVGE